MHNRTGISATTLLSPATAVLLVIGALATAGMAAEAAKPDTSKEDVTQLSDVNVTEDPLRALSSDPSASSFGFAKPLMETPRSVSFVSEEQLNLFSVRTVEDLTRLVPGTYTTTRYGLQGGINVRAVSADMYYRGMQRLNMQGHVRTILSAYDNIEVVRGPPSPLYGMGKIGGYQVLDPKSNRAKTGKYSPVETGYVQGTYGSYQQTELQFGYGKPFTVAGKSAGAYIVGLLEDSNTFVRHVGAQQRFLQATVSVDNAIGPFRLETGGQVQNSITSGAYMNRGTQNLVDNGIYISGSPLAKLDLNGDGRVGYVETYLASPVAGAIAGANQALTQRYTSTLDASGNPRSVQSYANTIVGIPASMLSYLGAHPEVSCPLANYMRTLPAMSVNSATSGMVQRQVPVGMVLNPCTVSLQQVDYRGNGSYEREQNALQRMGYLDFVYDTNPDFTVKNQIFYDSLTSFKDSWLPYGENQGISALEEKLTVTKRLPADWLPQWLAVNSLASANYRTTRGFLRSSGGDFDYRQDIMLGTGADGSGTGGHGPNTMFWTQLTNASYGTGTPYTTWRISDFNTSGLGVMFDIDIARNTNLLLGGRYDSTHAKAEDTQLQNPSSGTVGTAVTGNVNAVSAATIAAYINGTACQAQAAGCPGGITAPVSVSGSDSGTSWSASLSHQLPWGGLRPYVTRAQSTLTLDGSNNLFSTATVTGGKLVGTATMSELGIKGAFLKGKIQWTLDAFKQTRTDVSSPTDPSVAVEVTSTTTKGWEGDFKYVATRNLFLSLSGTWMDSRYVVGASGTNIDINGRSAGFRDIVDPVSGAVYPAEAFLYGGRTALTLTDPNNIYSQVPGLPKTQAAFTATYKLNKRWGSLLSAQYFSSSWADRLQTMTIPAATVLNGGITYDIGRLHLKINAFNLANKVYMKASIAGNINLLSVSPRQRFELSAKMDF
jgi:outer membrane receptor protein involved in Fe transport